MNPTRQERLARVRQELWPMLTGQTGDRRGIAAEFQATVANAFFRLVQSDTEVKSRGGRGIDGITWPKLAPSTLKSKGQPPYGLKILAEYGDLYRTLTPSPVPGRLAGVRGQVVRIDSARRAIVCGSREKVWHHRGVPGRLPRRRLWPMPELVPAQWSETLKAAVKLAYDRAYWRYFNEVAT
jgi:hypothetical protein